jgi:peptidoglycan hydrolase FlgJ
MELINATNDSLQLANSFTTGALAKKSGAQASAKDVQATKKVVREFEALFVGMMLKSMRETVGKDPIAGGGKGEEMFQSMLDQEYSKSITEHGGIGMAAMLEKQLTAQQGSSTSKAGIGEYKKISSGTSGVTK